MKEPIKLLIQRKDFDIAEELRLLRQQTKGLGAIVNFVGVVRDVNEQQQVAIMELEHYPGMTEKCIAEMTADALERWQLDGITVIHRVGKLSPGEQIVLVAVSAKHRGDAFSGCEFIIDNLKTRAPFWKKELTSEGERWVGARSSDHASAERWHKPD